MSVEPLAASVRVFSWRPIGVNRAARTTGWLSGSVADWLDQSRVEVIEGNWSLPIVIKRSWGYILAPKGTRAPTERNILAFEQLEEQKAALQQAGTAGSSSKMNARMMDQHPAIGATFVSYMQQREGDWGWYKATHVIRCTGWAFDQDVTPFSGDRPLESMTPIVDDMGKYPKTGPNWMLFGKKNLYVVGAAAHTLDHHISGGGTVSGFRYAARALDRWLGFNYDNTSWSGTTRMLAIRPMLLADKMLARASAPGGLTAMHKILIDTLVFTVSEAGALQALWYAEMPRGVAHGLTGTEFVLTLTMEFLSPESAAQPVIRFYPPGFANVTHHNPESTHTVSLSHTVPPTWHSHEQISSLVTWLKPIITELNQQVAVRVSKRKAAMERRTKKGVKSGDYKGLTLAQLFDNSKKGVTLLDRQNMLYEKWS